MVARWRVSYIKVGVVYTYIKMFKRTGLDYRKMISVNYFLLHYPTRDQQRSYELAINNFQLSENFSYPNIEKYTGGQITEGLLYYFYVIHIIYIPWNSWCIVSIVGKIVI